MGKSIRNTDDVLWYVLSTIYNVRFALTTQPWLHIVPLHPSLTGVDLHVLFR